VCPSIPEVWEAAVIFYFALILFLLILIGFMAVKEKSDGRFDFFLHLLKGLPQNPEDRTDGKKVA
jgi:heme/copper-type cytochrome/quinol oxidase subunit 4